MRSVSELILGVVVLGLCTAAVTGAWEWPVDGASRLVPGDGRDGWELQFVPQPRAETAAPFRVPADSTVVIDMSARDGTRRNTSAIPREQDLLIVRHSNELYSRFQSPSIELPRPVRPARGELLSTTALQYTDQLRFELLDGIARGPVNPRALLPVESPLPADGLPQLAFYQDGRRIPAADLLDGAVQMVVPADALDPSRLPYRIRTLEDGLLTTDVQFVTEEDFRSKLLPDGRLHLLDFRLPVGFTRLVIEIVRFNGEERSIRYGIDVPEPPPPPLDIE